jgi:predicted TIM-barrel fold metal-dependent hydrolase
VTPPSYLAALGEVFGGPPPGLVPSTAHELRQQMERYAIDAAVVSLGPPGVHFGDDTRAAELARRVNEEAAELVATDPARFAALAALPLPNVDAALREVTYALDELRLDGVFLLTNLAGAYLGDERFDALFDELERRRAYVFVHPALPPYPLPLQHPVWLYEFTFETTRAVAQLIYSGTLERCSNVRIQLAHLGGATPFLAHRLASLADREPALAEQAPAGALEYIGRLYYDTGLSNNGAALASALEATDVTHVVFGTDWPYAALADGEDPAPGLNWLGERRVQVEGTNAEALVPRFATP